MKCGWMRWMCGLLVLWLLIGMVSVGFAEEVVIEDMPHETIDKPQGVLLDIDSDSIVTYEELVDEKLNLDLEDDTLSIHNDDTVGEEAVQFTASEMESNTSDYTYEILYYEECLYDAVYDFNWHSGPSANAPTAGSIKSSNGFWSEAVIWNKSSNNMWLKKKGEEKYVFAGLHYNGERWYVDDTQKQYLYYWDDCHADPEWIGCNLRNASLQKGKSFALEGTLQMDEHVTIKSISGQLYQGDNPWGNPTTTFNVNSLTYPLYGSGLDMALKFGSLPVGEYKLWLTVTYLSNRGLTEKIRTGYVPFNVVDAHVADTVPPTIYDVKVSNVSTEGYTVSCNVSDNVGVTSVKFPTWTAQNDQDDIIWHEGQLSGNTASCTIRTSDHNNEKGCVYYTHIYAYDAAGNSSSDATSAEVPAPDATAPIISNVSVSNITSEGYTVSCDVSDNVGVTSVKFPTWTEQNGQDDIIWHEGQLSGNKASVYISVGDHNFERGCKYVTHIYAYDAAGNNSCFGTSANVPPQTVSPTGIQISDSSLTLIIGDIYGLTTIVSPSNATDKTVYWSSSDTRVATVSDGDVTAVSAGTATIKAITVNGLTASCSVTVKAPKPNNVILNKSKATVVVGAKLKLVASLAPSNAKTTLNWTTSNKKVATVSQKGIVKALKKGTATITVTTDNGKTATCVITVPKAPTKVKFKKSTYTVRKGKTIKLVPVLTPSGAKTTYKWSSSNKKIATVSSKGVVKGIKKGTAKITVKTANGKSKTVTIKVIVNDINKFTL